MSDMREMPRHTMLVVSEKKAIGRRHEALPYCRFRHVTVALFASARLFVDDRDDVDG